MTDVSKTLIEARNLFLRVPVITTNERALMRNPFRLLGDLNFSRTARSDATLLEDISFTLQPCERLGIIGANGTVKSTLSRVLAGIYAPISGKLKVDEAATGLLDALLGMHPVATGPSDGIGS